MIDDVAEIFSDRLTVKQGIFGALMEVSLINDGPLTMFIESRDGKIQVKQIVTLYFSFLQLH